MRRRAAWISLSIAAWVLSGLSAAPAAAEQRLGVGLHYWRTLDDLAGGDDIDRDGLAGLLTYQYAPIGLFKVQVDLEYFDSGFGGATEAAYSPQVYLVVGGKIYGAVGVGVLYSDSLEDNVSDPFYAFRVGSDFVILPRVHLDVNANYRTSEWDQIDADTDTVTLGAAVRFAF